MRARNALAGATLVALLFAPALASASTLEDIQAQVAALLQQVTEFQAQLLALKAAQAASSTTNSVVAITPSTTTATTTSVAATTSATTSASSTLQATLLTALQKLLGAGGAPAANATPTSAAAVSCPTLGRTLTIGAQGNDVLALQNFLGAGGFLTTAGTGYFGALTQSAVQAWQSAHGIASSGSPETTGWGLVGAKTRAAIAAACGNAPLPPNDTLSIGSQGLSAIAPVTVNVRGSCSAITYSLNWGDGSPATSFAVSAGSCAPLQQQFSHAYAAGGSYTVVLSTNGYTITAPISITAPAAKCSAPVFATDTIPGSIVGQAYSLPLFVANATDMLSVGMSGAPASLALDKKIAVNASTTAVSYIWALSGTPTTTGTYSISFSAKNSCGTASRTISLPVSNPSSVQCSAPIAPTCSNGTLSFLGNDVNGCSLGYQCITPNGTPVVTSCPSYQLPVCVNGTYVAQGYDTNGCALPPKCVINANISIALVAPQMAAQGSTVTFTWNTQNAPANSAVSLSTNSAGRIQDALPTSGSFSWTIPGPSCDANGNCHAIADNPFVWATAAGTTYQITARLYTPANASLGGGLIAPSSELQTVATSPSTSLTITQ